MRTHVVRKHEFLVFVAHFHAIQELQDCVFRYDYITFGGHAADLRGDSLANLDFKVLGPAVLAKVVAARETVEFVAAMRRDANGTRLTFR